MVGVAGSRENRDIGLGIWRARILSPRMSFARIVASSFIKKQQTSTTRQQHGNQAT